MVEIKSISKDMHRAAKALKEGPLLIVYRDGNAIRCETRDGEDPYVWRRNKWRPMSANRQ